MQLCPNKGIQYLCPRPVASLTLGCRVLVQGSRTPTRVAFATRQCWRRGSSTHPSRPPRSCVGAEDSRYHGMHPPLAPATALSAARCPLTPRRRRRRKREGGPGRPGRGRERHGGGGGRGAPGQALRAREGSEWGQGPLSRECPGPGSGRVDAAGAGLPSTPAALSLGSKELGQIGGGEGGRGWRAGVENVGSHCP